MKKIVFIMMSLALTIAEVAAQYSGRKFITGNAAINLNSMSYGQIDVSRLTSGLNGEISMGRFLTDQKATGFRLSGGLSYEHEKNFYQVNPMIEDQKNGISGFSLGAGKFWQYYKHFGESWGIHGGPSLDFLYNHQKTIEEVDSERYARKKTNTFQLGFSLSGGAYYRIADRWWLNASVAFSNPINVSFAQNRRVNHNLNSGQELPGETKGNTFSYRIIPSLQLPSVGLGLTYFLK